MLLHTTISYALGETNGALSPYTNFIIGASIEAVGYFTAGLLISSKLGRKDSLIMFVLLTTASVLTIPFVMDTRPIVTTVISQVGKFGVSAAVAVSWLLVSELFPPICEDSPMEYSSSSAALDRWLHPLSTRHPGRNIAKSFIISTWDLV